MNTSDIPDLQKITFPSEHWKFVEHPQILQRAYLVSSLARVYSLVSNRLLTPAKHNQGYLALTMLRREPPIGAKSKYGSHYKKVLLHDIVGLAFVPNPNPDEYDIINHIDGDKRNNLPSNLEWVNHAMNTEHAFRTGLQHGISQPGTANPNSRYSEIMIHWMCFLMENYGTISAARLFVNSFPQFTVQSVSKYMQTKLKSGFLYQDIVSKYDVFAGKELERETGKITEDDISMLNNEGSSIIESTD